MTKAVGKYVDVPIKVASAARIVEVRRKGGGRDRSRRVVWRGRESVRLWSPVVAGYSESRKLPARRRRQRIA